MEYNKIKEKINSTYREVKLFFEMEGEEIGFTLGGFYQAVRNDSLKVATLEKISQKLGVSMSYWWMDDKESLVEDPERIYGENPVTVIKRLNAIIDQCMDDKNRLKEQIDELKNGSGIKREKVLKRGA
jgi:hypothetical protein